MSLSLHRMPTGRTQLARTGNLTKPTSYPLSSEKIADSDCGFHNVEVAVILQIDNCWCLCNSCLYIVSVPKIHNYQLINYRSEFLLVCDRDHLASFAQVISTLPIKMMITKYHIHQNCLSPDHLFHRHGVWRDDLWNSL